MSVKESLMLNDKNLEIARLRGERDELREALLTLLEAVVGNHLTMGDINQARAALGKVGKA